MATDRPVAIRTAEVVLACDELEPTLGFFIRLGFRLEAIYPADQPRVASLGGHGLRIRLERGASGAPAVLRLGCDDPGQIAEGATTLTAPNGTRIELVDASPGIVLPPLQPSFVVSLLNDATWSAGRAGMRYRDLIPDRQGGRFIASHIQIPEGGPVPDYVHYHRVQFQMIYCYRGWVRVVYEDQGSPFVMHAGDCVLQPPEIRHRVLESSDGLEVIEVGCPAEHETLVEPEIELPTSTRAPEREFGGQRFVRHRASTARWQPWRLDGFECRDTGIAAATGGIASARVARPAGAISATPGTHDGELLFLFVLDGSLSLQSERGGETGLQAGDSVVVPGGHNYGLERCSEDLELLEVTIPAL